MNTNLDLTTISHFGTVADSRMAARKTAADHFNKALSEGRRNRFWNRISGRPGRLKLLNKTLPPCRGRRNSGILFVPISRIVGSEGRSEDFDAEFHPLKTHNQDRWISIAVARRMGIALSPVELVQDEEYYYVRDGHHRISVARAMGQVEIEARIVN